MTFLTSAAKRACSSGVASARSAPAKLDVTEMKRSRHSFKLRGMQKKMRRISSDWCAERLQLDASNYSSRFSFLAPLCRPAGGRTFLNKDSLMIANESGCFAEMLDSLILKILKSGPSVGNIS